MAVEVEEIYEAGVYYIKVNSDKVNVSYQITKKPSNPTMWFITPDKGFLPEILQGRYTTPGKALADLTKYLNNSKMSATRERDIKYERSKAQKEARVASKSNDQNDL